VPIPNEYVDIVETLLLATRGRRVRWRIGSHGISVGIAGSQFAVWAGTDEQTARPFVSFALQDAKGEILDSWNVDMGEREYEPMNELYQTAIRQAKGIPEKLKELQKTLKTLKTGGIIGEEKES